MKTTAEIHLSVRAQKNVEIRVFRLRCKINSVLSRAKKLFRVCEFSRSSFQSFINSIVDFFASSLSRAVLLSVDDDRSIIEIEF